MISLLGIALFPLIAYLMSTNRQAISPRTVLGAFALQAGLGGLILYVPLGKDLLTALADKVVVLLGYSKAGIDFLFGSLAAEDAGFVFAINVLPVIIFFSSLIAVLYYLNVMQWMIKLIGGALRKLLKTSHTESMASAANIFIGQTEAPLVVPPVFVEIH